MAAAAEMILYHNFHSHAIVNVISGISIQIDLHRQILWMHQGILNSATERKHVTIKKNPRRLNANILL
jgi:hypothetical protein